MRKKDSNLENETSKKVNKQSQKKIEKKSVNKKSKIEENSEIVSNPTKEKISNTKKMTITNKIIIPIIGLLVTFIIGFIPIYNNYLKKNDIVVLTKYNYSPDKIIQLKNIEDRLNSIELIDSLPQFNKLIDYYIYYNEDILRAIENSNSKIIITAPAGAGKSFLFRHIESLIKDSSYNLCKIKLKSICSHKSMKNGFSLQPQLINLNSNYEFTYSLPYKSDFDINSLLQYKNYQYNKDADKNFVIIDDCDEWHPEAINNILSSINDYFIENNDEKWCFIFCGRPEAFTSFESNTHRESARNFEKKQLKLPLFYTTGDIKLKFKDALEYDSTEVEINENVHFDLLYNSDNLTKGFILNEMKTLEGGNYITALLNNDKLIPLNEIKKELFNNYISRNYDSHNKPKPSYLFYIALLKEAATYLMAKQDVKDGYFQVTPNDKVSIKIYDEDDNKYKIINVEVNKLLDFSGLIEKRKKSSNVFEYRFFPFWIHRYLVETDLKDI